MEKRFHMDEKNQIRVMSNDLRRSVYSIFLEMGLSQSDAFLATDVLVTADDRGTETHGVSNLMRTYIDWFNKKIINPCPNWKIIRETASTASIDSDSGLGLVVIPKAMELAIKKAKKTGVGAVTISNGNHAGMMAYHSMLALPHDMIGYAATAGGQNLVPTFGSEPRLGANPHSWAVPALNMPPFVLDISSSSIAAGKLGLLRRLGKLVKPGLISSKNGRPIMRDRPIPKDLLLLPLGSTPEMGSHKGYGLSAIAQIFGGILSSGSFGPTQGEQMTHFVVAYSIEAFTDLHKFKSSMDDFLQFLAETPPGHGHERVYYAGLRAHEETNVRAKKGIPLHEEVVAWFDSITIELGTEPLVR